MERKTDQEFKEEAKEKNNKVEVIGTYVRLKDKILVKCNMCGYEFYTLPGAVLSGHGCRKCADLNNSLRQTMSAETFEEKIFDLNPFLKIEEKYEKSSKPIKCACMKCGYVFYPRPANLLFRKASCPKCSRKKLTKTQQEFERDVFKINPDIEILGEYISNDKRILCKCKKCNEEWNPKATWVLQGKGCPHCNDSKGEKRIKSFLIDNKIKFIQQYKFDGCKDRLPLPFDFYLPEYNICCEFDGVQHYEEVNWTNSSLNDIKKHDNIKNAFCLDNGILLIRIPYWDLKNIDKLLSDILLAK